MANDAICIKCGHTAENHNELKDECLTEGCDCSQTKHQAPHNDASFFEKEIDKYGN